MWVCALTTDARVSMKICNIEYGDIYILKYTIRNYYRCLKIRYNIQENSTLN